MNLTAAAGGGGAAADVRSKEDSGEQNKKAKSYGNCVAEANGAEVLRKGVVRVGWGDG